MAPFSKRRLFRKIFRRELPNLPETGSPGESSLSRPSTLYKNQPPTVTRDSHSLPVTLASQDQIIRNRLGEDVSDSRSSLGNIGLQLFSTEHLSQDKVKVIKSKLEDATERLNNTIIEHERRNKNQGVEFNTEGMIKVMQKAGTSPQSGIVFGEYIEGVVAKQRFLRDETTRGKLTHYAAKLYPVTRMVLGVVSFSADAASFSPVKMAANGLQLVLSAAMDVHEQGEDIIQQLEALNDYGPFLENLRELDNSSQLVERACEFLIETTNFLNASLEHLDKSTLRKAVSESWVMSKESFESARKRLDEQVERDMQINLFKWIKQNKNDRILTSISVDTSYREKQQQYSARRMPNIGQWVLDNENFMEWREWERERRTDNARVLCCTGLPGAGKTFIA
ncbi:hypothetical protein F4815DRAFT_405063 [Daldinia loculata]|nr:hypothetical protein F4815DRAFT_405063 [Daldinia loculata]